MLSDAAKHYRDLAAKSKLPKKPCSGCGPVKHTKEELATVAERNNVPHALERFRGLYKGRRGFILATGPSVAQQDITWLKDEVVLGINFAHKITLPQNWVPTFMVTADATVLERLQDEWEHLDTNVVVTDTCMLKVGYVHTNLVSGTGVSLKYNKDLFIYDCTKLIHIPLCYSTVGHVALPFACFLGCNPIYLLGCDCSSGGHAYDDKGVRGPANAADLMSKHFRPGMKKIREITERLGIRIYNAGLGGTLEEFERISLESLRP